MAHRTIGFTGSWTEAFYTGAAVLSEVPDRWPCAINGRPYVIAEDDQSTAGDVFREEGLPLLREGSDAEGLPSEVTISAEQPWRRSQDRWDLGAGQTFLDRRESEPRRFLASKGINPWEPWELSLLHDTERTDTFAGSVPALVSTGSYVYGTDGGNTLFRSADGITWTDITGIPGADCKGLATSGSTVWAAFGASGVYASAESGTSAAALVAGQADSVGFAKGYLLVGSANNLHEIPSGAGALGTALYTHFDADWRWVAYAESGPAIYAAGHAGQSGAIYRISIAEDGSALEPPVQAAPLPAGERPYALLGYLGFLIIGTSAGVRFAVPDAQGDLTVGALIPTNAPVRCLTAYDRFVWFGWSDYDGESTGLGRLDLSVLGEGLAPAYASDLMAASSGAVGGVAYLGGRLIFAVASDGLYREADTPVAEGYLDSGGIVYGLGDPKAAVALDIRHEPLPAGASVVTQVTADGANARIGVSDAAGTSRPTSTITLPALRGERMDVRITLRATGAAGPVLTRWTLLAQPAPSGIRTRWSLPLMLYDTVRNERSGASMDLDVAAEHDFLLGLYESQAIVQVQLGGRTFPGVVKDWRFLPKSPSRRASALWQGTLIVRVQEVSA